MSGTGGVCQPDMVTASYRFYAELNDFLPPARRQRQFNAAGARSASVKHMIEALGVPHTEVEVILVNGVSVGFGQGLAAGDRVSVYPKFEALDVTPLLRVRDHPLRRMRFLADAHLGGLARLLRLAGFDTRYDNLAHDDAIEAMALSENRIVLSRDRELLKCRAITHGCYIHALDPEAQFRELVARLDLARLARPFSRCLVCNGSLRAVAKARVLHRLPPRVREGQARFRFCRECGRVYWEGTHWQRLRSRLSEMLSETQPNNHALDQGT